MIRALEVRQTDLISPGVQIHETPKMTQVPPTFLTKLSSIPADMGKIGAGNMVDTNIKPSERFSDGTSPRLA